MVQLALRKKKESDRRNLNVNRRFVAKGRFPDILEMALLDPLNGKTWHQKFGSQKFIHQRVVDLLRINVPEVRARPAFSTRVLEIIDWIDPDEPDGLVLLFAHNGHRFDHKIFKHHLQEYGAHVPPNWYFVDTLPMAKELVPFLRSYSLLNLARGQLLEDPKGLHAADADVRILWRVMEKLVGKKGDDAVRQLGRLGLQQVFGREFLDEVQEEEELEEVDFWNEEEDAAEV